MRTHFFSTVLAAVLAIVLIVPTAFLIVPQRAEAQLGAIGCLMGVAAGLAAAAAEEVTNVPSIDEAGAIGSVTSGGATEGSCIQDAVIAPLARMLARVVLQQITAKTISWINGGNSKGQTSFVTNIAGNLQTAGDTQAVAFFAQFGRNSNSPFSSAIISSLQRSYAFNTSSAGFFAANRSTLARYSPNPNAFLAGNFSQGGIPAWFALTTQSQNNPYTLYNAAQSQLASVVGSAQAVRSAALNWGQGFLSWCSTTAAAAETQGSATADYQACQANGGTGDECAATFDAAGGTVGGETKSGVNPGDSCTNGDGTPGTVETPGSIIHDYTQKAVVATGIDQLVSAQDLDSALGSIVTALAGQVLGGITGASRSSASTGRPAFTTQLQTYSSTNTAATGAANSTAQSIISQLTAYTSAWSAISVAANNASALLAGVVNTCASISPADAGAASAVFANRVQPLIAQAQAALAQAAKTRAFADKVQAETVAVNAANSGSSQANVALSADLQTLLAMPPASIEIVNAQSNGQATGASVASPAGSLSVSRGTTLDQMNLIAGNASAIQASCSPSTAASATQSANNGSSDRGE